MWNIFSTILNIILGLLSIYLYFENRRLKGFEIDKNIKIKEVEIKQLNQWYPKAKEKLDNAMAERGLTFSGTRLKAESDLVMKYNNNLAKLESELNYFKRIKRYKWIFSK